MKLIHSGTLVRALAVCAVALSFGCATAQPVADTCRSAATGPLDSAVAHYESYRSGGLEPGAVYAIRDDVERAREALYGEASACTRRDRRLSTFEDLEDRFGEAEWMARELENARGVRFVGFEDERPQWRNVENGQLLPAHVAASI